MLHIISTSDEKVLNNCTNALCHEDEVVLLVVTFASKISDEIKQRLGTSGTKLNHILATDKDIQKLNGLNSKNISYDDFVLSCTKHPNITTWY